MESGVRQSTFVYNVDREDPISIDLDGGPRVYFPGDRISGTVRLGLRHPTPGQLIVFLACKARLQSGKQRPLFKVSLDPYVVTSATTVPFSILIPSDIPSSIHHERIPGSITYSVKAVHQLPDLPCCVWPKASAAVEIRDRISVLDDCYTKELTSEGQLSFNIPHDIIMKQCILKKGRVETAAAWVYVPRSCYLPDQVIPVTLQVRHFAPIRLVDGVILHLDRITQTMAANDQVSYDTMSIAHVALPLSCDDSTFQTKFTTNALKVPADTPPTLNSHRYPLRITYRLRAIINLDMDGLPLRKRDRVASYVGKVMRFTEEMNANGSTIVLDVPLVVGTSEEPPVNSVKSLFDGGYGLFKEESKLISCASEAIPSVLLNPPPEYTSLPSILVRRLSIAKADDYFDQAPPYSVAKHPSAPNLQDLPPFLCDSIPRQPSAPSLQELNDSPHQKTQRRSWSHPLQHSRTSSTSSLQNMPPPPPPHHVHEYSRETL